MVLGSVATVPTPEWALWSGPAGRLLVWSARLSSGTLRPVGAGCQAGVALALTYPDPTALKRKGADVPNWNIEKGRLSEARKIVHLVKPLPIWKRFTKGASRACGGYSTAAARSGARYEKVSSG
jgi:hypothetical protein